MLEFIISLITPFCTSLGVSVADVTSYVYQLGEYIYGLFALFILMAVVILGAVLIVERGPRHIVCWTSVLAFLLAVVLVVNLVAFGPMYANLSGALNASPIELSDDVTANSRAVIEQVGDEGLVLVKNNGLLPLAPTANLNVFGWDSIRPLYGGTGSGASDASTAVGILQSLQDAGFATNESLTAMYTAYRAERPVSSISAQDWTLPEPTREYYTDELMQSAMGFSDTAVIVIGRCGGEGADLPTDMYSVIHGSYDIRNTGVINEMAAENYGYTNAAYTNNGAYDDFDPGETYLELSNTEEAMIELVCSSFPKVIVVINSNNVMELGWVDDYASIGAVILAPGTGATGMEALGRVISGAVNPSGRTVDTYVKDLSLIPTFNNFGNYSWSNVDSLKNKLAAMDRAYEGNLAFVNYTEGIYVGYKFYETAADDGVLDYSSVVQYPFGYGLSYTTFEQKITGFDQNRSSVTVKVEVTNTGTTAGKDVVELYFTPPYTNGGIEKASVNLVDFAKTDLLQPGQSETVVFEIPLEELAAYDGGCVKTANGGYVLEAGEYKLSIRSESHTILEERAFTVAEDTDYSAAGRESDAVPAGNRFGYAEGNVTYLSRANGFANLAQAAAAPQRFEMDEATLAIVTANTTVGFSPKALDNAEDVMPTLGADNGLVLSDLTGASYDDERWELLLDQLSIDDMITLINVGGWQTAAIDSVGKIATSDCDGPAGLNNIITQNQGTAYPAEVLMAQTWSKAMAAKIGDAMGQEYTDANNFGWYGPAMNIHRSPFGGRNFEYYSEDGVLSGRLASEQVRSAAKWGVYPYIKHFALNDQETNRCSILLTYCNEQAIREIYLRPFEIVIKNFDFDRASMAVMSSFNWIGPKPASACSELLNTVLRDEWGFRGMVETDYDGSYGFMISDNCVRNGNDLMLGFGQAATNNFSDTDAATCVLAMRQACKNILYTVSNSGYYKDASAVQEAGGTDHMTKVFVTADIIAVLAILAIEAFVVIRWIRKRKKDAIAAEEA